MNELNKLNKQFQKQQEVEETNQQISDLELIGKQAFLAGISTLAFGWVGHEIGNLIPKVVKLFNKK